MLTQRIARFGSRIKSRIVVGMVPVTLLVRSTVEMYINRKTAQTTQLRGISSSSYKYDKGALTLYQVQSKT